MAKRGIKIDFSTPDRAVVRYAPKLEKASSTKNVPP